MRTKQIKTFPWGEVNATFETFPLNRRNRMLTINMWVKSKCRISSSCLKDTKLYINNVYNDNKKCSLHNNVTFYMKVNNEETSITLLFDISIVVDGIVYSKVTFNEILNSERYDYDTDAIIKDLDY